MSFKPFTILLLLAIGYHTALAFPAPSGSSEVTQSDVNSVPTVLASNESNVNNLAGTGGNPKLTPTKTPAPTPEELSSLCAPLLSGVAAKPTPTVAPVKEKPKTTPLGGKNTAVGKGETTLPPKKSSASLFARSSLITTALPVIFSTGMGLLVL